VPIKCTDNPVDGQRCIWIAAAAFIDAARQMGMPILDDVTGPMRLGAGYINMNIGADGTRMSAVRAFLRPALSRPNLTLLLNARYPYA
jgi:choline dehydrogenase-like flavoprotein